MEEVILECRKDLSDIPLTHRRDRIEVLAGIAGDEDEKSDTRIRAIKQIADETAADVEGMIESLQEQIGILELPDRRARSLPFIARRRGKCS